MGGTAAWRNRIAPHTASLMRRLRAAGMINLGKTTHGGVRLLRLGYQPASGHALEPLGCQHTPPVRGLVLRLRGRGCGADGAMGDRNRHGRLSTHPGSVERVTGLKTTIGLSPMLDTSGPITRDIEDAALLLVLQREDRRDRRTLGVRDVDPMPELRRGVKGLRLAWIPNSKRDGIDVDVLAAYDRSVDRMVPGSSMWHCPRG
jgi:aspartyl-tRNA(Asn)/glutamyl-tRNA(Gln) amidotransferase subunit A